ncbi:paraquat-inducible protein A [Aliiroseovarius lamellibrachiae]|uniref:paraquat-inducible protein A n=1 Tax=Aliiroseovarius lamellibrachiae TaxID=1924933 RepID=UPI001BE04905|nr:paraquat-inducible protein A [Aliiroseovarius lamellibrachiae]MBT2131165.1 paraquat-inducible protein A [Aliiroseovarius lamellibrachiae]
MTYLRYLNLALLIAFPIAWFAPLLRAGLNLPFFGQSEISIISGLQTLWKTDVFLALLITLFAIFAPLIKTLGLALIQFGQMRRSVLPVFNVMGKLAMADIFLIALYVVVAKGAGMARVDVAWGLYLFTGCVLISLGISMLTQKRRSRPKPTLD